MSVAFTIIKELPDSQYKCSLIRVDVLKVYKITPADYVPYVVNMHLII